MLTASIEVDGVSVPVKLRNLSGQGALIEADRLPAEGSSTCFRRKDLSLGSRVVWVQGRYAGVAFDRPLNPEELLRYVPPAKPKPQMDFRRPGLTSRPLTAHERRMMESWMDASPHGSIGD